MKTKLATLSQPVLRLRNFYFYRRDIGIHFRVEANGTFPIDEAAGLLAVHCMSRGLQPTDYIVMVEAEPEILKELNEKAEKLLQAGQSISGPVKLTRREEQVLSGVVRVQANKEIAATLNLSERTVKFHVSSLLAKFGVRSRMELVRDSQIPLQAVGGGA